MRANCAEINDAQNRNGTNTNVQNQMSQIRFVSWRMMYNLDRAAAAAPYLKFDKDMREALSIWRTHSYLHVDNQQVLDWASKIGSHFNTSSHNIHFFNSASSAVRFLSSELNVKFICTRLDHKCLKDYAIHVIETNSKDFDLKTNLVNLKEISKNNVVAVTLKNNELGFELPDEFVSELMSGNYQVLVDATGGDPGHPLLKVAKYIIASPCKWGGMPGSGLLIVRDEISTIPSSKLSGWGLGTPSLTAIRTTLGCLDWISSPLGRAAEKRTSDYLHIFESLATELGWKKLGAGKFICTYDIGLDSHLFLTQLAEAGVIAGRGAACSNGEPSEIISALFNKSIAERTVRFSWDRSTKKEDVNEAVNIIRDTYLFLQKTLNGEK